MYDELNTKYGQSWQYPAPPTPKAGGDWKVIETNGYKGNVQLSTAYPNPFENTSRFSVYIPEKQNVKIALYDSYGNQVKILENGTLTAGIHDYLIDGSVLNSGLYLFRATGENFVKSGSVILTK